MILAITQITTFYKQNKEFLTSSTLEVVTATYNPRIGGALPILLAT